jgi:hypothetical protein
MKVNLKLTGGKEIIKSLTEEKERIQKYIDELYTSIETSENLMSICDERISYIEDAIASLENCV